MAAPPASFPRPPLERPSIESDASSLDESNTGSRSAQGQSPEQRKHRISEREKRTYRACLHCRQRKSRCDLYSSGEPGRPPCERCIRENHECVLGGSRRGGKRIKRTHDDSSQTPAQQPTPVRESPQHFRPPSRQGVYASPGVGEPRLPSWSCYATQHKNPPVPQEPPVDASASTKMTVDDTIASADLQNPSDALEFLAHVADRAEGNQLPPIAGFFRGQRSTGVTSAPLSTPVSEHVPPSNYIQFPPLQRGQVNIEVIHELQRRYEERYHPFFPLANPEAFNPSHLPRIALKEPHLLTAICTVASKDDKDWWQIHEACSAHMQQLIATLVYCGGGTVEAVEALLILAEWVPRPPHAAPAIGRGEEDQAAWMHVGTAIRLGYLLGLDRTAFRNETDQTLPDLNRRRLAWAGCYMSDRQISVRIGKAFWSRGPGPMTGLNARDFPSLQPRHDRNDDYAAIFQANLELTQLFSNAHDVLYSSKNRSSQLNSGGEYVKYIDDFRVAIRNWHSQWGTLSCSPPLKASLILSYEYLRLYCNAFAYQATLSRMVVQNHEASMGTSGPQSQRSSRSSARHPFTDFVAATPDARFIYDSVDAAKSLLSTFNSFVDPVLTFRYMPLRYYLYVIYSACFLYKARSTGVLGGDRGTVKRAINDTVERLQKASACANDVGDRYSRLIKLLWRKPPTQTASGDISRAPTAGPARGSIASVVSEVPQQQQSGAQAQQQIPHEGNGDYAYDPHAQPHMQHVPSINAFSWLDLSAVGDFATNNGSISGSLMDGLDAYDDTSTDAFSNFDPTGVGAPSMVGVSPMGFEWNGVSPPGIIF